MSEPFNSEYSNNKNAVSNSQLTAGKSIHIGDNKTIITIPSKELVFHKKFEKSSQHVVGRSFYQLIKSDKKIELQDEKIHITDIFKELNNNKRLVLLGEAGLGKSIELEKIASFLARKEGVAVAMVKLTNLEKGDIIPSFKINKKDIISHDNKVLLVDGLDEVNLENARKSIDDICQSFPSLKVIVTCRANLYLGQLSDFTKIYIDRLSSDEFDQFLERRLDTSDKDNFKRAIPSVDFQILLSIPFYLDKAILYFIDNSHELPKSKTELLDYFIAESLKVRLGDDSKLKSNEGLRKACIDGLKKVAFTAECMGVNQLSIEKFKELIGRDEGVELIFSKSSLIHSNSEGIQFAHRLLQEFLSAKVLMEVKSIRRLKKIICSNSQSRFIKRSWVNTLSYFWELVQERPKFCAKLLKWLLESNPEIIIRFEAGSISQEHKNAVIANILDGMVRKKITFDYREYTPKELAQFCQSSTVFLFLKDRLASTNGVLDNSNVLKLLAWFSPSYLGQDEENILRDILLSQILISDSYSKYLATTVLINLYDNVSPEEARKIARKLFDSEESPYDRLSAYRLINAGRIHSEWLERLLKRMIELSDTQLFSGTPLMDESFYLEECIRGTSETEAVISYFELYPSIFQENNHYHDVNFFGEFIDKALMLALTQADYSRIFSAIKVILVDNMVIDLGGIINHCLNFIEQTKNQPDIVRYCLDRASDYPQELIAHFASKETFPLIVGAYQASTIDARWVNIFIGWLHRKSVESEKDFVEFINSETNSSFQAKEYSSMPTVSPQEMQEKQFREGLALFFSREDLIEHINQVFDALDIDDLALNKISDILKEAPLEDQKKFYKEHFSQVIQLINNNNRRSKNELIQDISENWMTFSVSHIRSYFLYNRRDFQLEPYQVRYLTNWCDTHAKKINLEEKITHLDRSFFFYLIFLRLTHYPTSLYLEGIQYGLINSHIDDYNLIQLALDVDGVEISLIESKLLKGIKSGTIKNYALHHVLNFIKDKKIKTISPVLIPMIKSPNTQYRYVALNTYLECNGEKRPLLDILMTTSEEDEFEDQLIGIVINYFPNEVQGLLIN